MGLWPLARGYVRILIRAAALTSALIVGIVPPAAAATPRVRVVKASQLISTRISYKSSGSVRSRVIYCLGVIPGDAKAVAGGLLFTPTAVTLAKMKARQVSGTKLTLQKAINKAGNSACSRSRNVRPPTPTPTATPSVIGSGNFDSGGNVTAKGRTAFGIPNGLSGNITAGGSLTRSYCSCHAERIGRSFPSLRSAIAQSPMFFNSTQITDPMLANITAYLNRFNS